MPEVAVKTIFPEVNARRIFRRLVHRLSLSSEKTYRSSFIKLWKKSEGWGAGAPEGFSALAGALFREGIGTTPIQSDTVAFAAVSQTIRLNRF